MGNEISADGYSVSPHNFGHHLDLSNDVLNLFRKKTFSIPATKTATGFLWSGVPAAKRTTSRENEGWLPWEVELCLQMIS